MPASKSCPVDLAGILSSRICHDLVSPVGAIVNGVDLIRELGAGGLDDELGMISQSAERASALLQFYRLAFGIAANDAETVSRLALHDRARTLFPSARVSLRWAVAEGPPLGRPEARLACQLVLCARSISGMAAEIEVRMDAAETFPLTVRVHGEGAGDAPDRLAFLAGAAVTAEVTPRVIEFALACESAVAMGLHLASEREPGLTTIAVRRP